MNLAIVGGVVVDGTGAPRRHADIGIEGGRIVRIAPPGTLAGESASVMEADGLVVAPGFVDIHTHYDAQAFWDPACTPSSLHGVTTVIGGNCGFTITPLQARDQEYMLTLLAVVEGMTAAALAEGVPWDWHTMADYLQRLDGNVAVNAGFMAGHSAIRRSVMGTRAVGETATDAEVDAMRALLAECLTDGALGFSSSWGPLHFDGDGAPVPSRHATAEELVSLSEVVREFPGTSLEFIPHAFGGDADADVMIRMSLAADRALNWNLLVITEGNEADVEMRLAASDLAAARGAKVVALTVPDVMRFRAKIDNFYKMVPGWEPVLSLPHEQLVAALGDPAVRERLAEGMNALPPGSPLLLDAVVVLETFSAENQHFTGSTGAEIAAAVGKPVLDAVLDLVVADDLRTALAPMSTSDGDDVWERRLATWRDPRVMLGGSDSGAHLDSLTTFNCTTAFLGEHVRDRGLMGLEEAVHRLTDAPARFYGLTSRGRIEEGWCADLVVFDPERVGPGPVHTRHDLPAGAGRLFGEAEGIEHVLVNGTEIVRGTTVTGATPGVVLRGGRDTES